MALLLPVVNRFTHGELSRLSGAAAEPAAPVPGASAPAASNGAAVPWWQVFGDLLTR
jgi:hypothetical protein